MIKRGFFVVLLGGAIANANATDARSYVLVPEGTLLTEVRYAASEMVTPSAPYDVVVKNSLSSLKNTYYFNFLGDLAAVQLTLPYADSNRRIGSTSQHESGFGDPTVLIGWGFYGMPALNNADFKKRQPDGISSAITAQFTFPYGEYNNRSSFNIGGNRTVQKYELQGAWRNGGLIFEALGGFSRFGKNDEYRGFNSLEQKPLYHFETHLSYNFTPDYWLSFDSFYINGGEYVLNDRGLNNPQRSFSGGVTMAYRVFQSQFVKLIYQNTLNKSDVSSKLEGFAVSYNFLW